MTTDLLTFLAIFGLESRYFLYYNLWWKVYQWHRDGRWYTSQIGFPRK